MSVTRYIILQKALYDTCISRAKVTPFVSKKKSCTYSRITNDSQISLSCYLVFLLWYVELKYLIKSVLKPLKLGALPPGPHQGFALDPDPSLLAPLSTNLRSPSDMYLKLSCMPEKRVVTQYLSLSIITWCIYLFWGSSC